MPRPKKDSVKVSYTLEREVVDLLDTFCEKTGRTKTKVVEMAIKAFIKEHQEKDG